MKEFPLKICWTWLVSKILDWDKASDLLRGLQFMISRWNVSGSSLLLNTLPPWNEHSCKYVAFFRWKTNSLTLGVVFAQPESPFFLYLAVTTFFQKPKMAPLYLLHEALAPHLCSSHSPHLLIPVWFLCSGGLVCLDCCLSPLLWLKSVFIHSSAISVNTDASFSYISMNFMLTWVSST